MKINYYKNGLHVGRPTGRSEFALIRLMIEQLTQKPISEKAIKQAFLSIENLSPND